MLGPDLSEQISRALADLRLGLPIVVSAQTSAIIAPIETLDQTRFDQLRGLAPDPQILITQRRAETIKIYAFDGAAARIEFPADRGLTWAKQVADPARDIEAGLKGPFRVIMSPKRGVENCALALLKMAQLLPAAMVVSIDDGATFATTHQLTHLQADQVEPRLRAPLALADIASARLPTQSSDIGRLHVFRPESGQDEHYAMEIGRPNRDDVVLVRLHSACFTGDVMGSLKCDCGPQLRAAMAQMGQAGAGILLYLNQEGRGIGLVNKMRAYSLQDQGFDTVDANHRLGFEDDERDFRLGAMILKEMGIQKIKLLTNNPRKIDIMERNGITVVDRVPLQVGQTQENSDYLATKAKKSGHML